MAQKKNKVKFGLNKVHYAKITGWSADDVPTFAPPVRIPGAVSLSMDVNGENENFFADNSVYYVINNNAGYTGYNGGSSWSNGQGGNWKPINKDELKQKRDAALGKIAGNPNLQQALENLVNSEDGYIIDIILKYV